MIMIYMAVISLRINSSNITLLLYRTNVVYHGDIDIVYTFNNDIMTSTL